MLTCSVIIDQHLPVFSCGAELHPRDLNEGNCPG